MRSLNEKVTSLKEKDIPALEQKLSDLDKVIISDLLKVIYMRIFSHMYCDVKNIDFLDCSVETPRVFHKKFNSED